MTYPHITSIAVFYETSDGHVRVTDSQDPRGDAEWSAEDWLNLICAKPRVRSHWLKIQVIREKPELRKEYLSPLYRTMLLINPPERKQKCA
jgi:hypothetical protein